MCRNFPFKYAVHAPNDYFNPDKLAELVDYIQAGIVVFHNIYWEDEWEKIVKSFDGVRAKLCIENTYSVHEPVKFIRRYGLFRCLDLEHLQMECSGFFEEEFLKVMKEASHVHLTGYTYGSELWHTHIHQTPTIALKMLNLLKKAQYRGFVVSEARTNLQTYKELKKLKEFFQTWQRNRN